MTFDRSYQIAFHRTCINLHSHQQSIGGCFSSVMSTAHYRFFLFMELITTTSSVTVTGFWCCRPLFLLLWDQWWKRCVFFITTVSVLRTRLAHSNHSPMTEWMVLIRSKDIMPMYLRVDFRVKYWLWTPYLYFPFRRELPYAIYSITDSGKAISIA